MKDDDLKNFLRRNDAQLDRPLGEWSRIESRLPRPMPRLWSWRQLSWLAGVLVAASVTWVVWAPQRVDVDQEVLGLFEESGSYLSHLTEDLGEGGTEAEEASVYGL